MWWNGMILPNISAESLTRYNLIPAHFIISIWMAWQDQLRPAITSGIFNAALDFDISPPPNLKPLFPTLLSIFKWCILLDNINNNITYFHHKLWKSTIKNYTITGFLDKIRSIDFIIVTYWIRFVFWLLFDHHQFQSN